MAENNPDQKTAELLAHADRLMHRRRVFIASQTSADTALPDIKPEPTPSTPPDEPSSEQAFIRPVATTDEDNDLPVLTERVDATQASSNRTEETPSLAHAVEAALHQAVQKELANWLEQELPDTILHVTDRLADQLLGEITRTAEAHLLTRILASINTTTAQASPKNENH